MNGDRVIEWKERESTFLAMVSCWRNGVSCVNAGMLFER